MPKDGSWLDDQPRRPESVFVRLVTDIFLEYRRELDEEEEACMDAAIRSAFRLHLKVQEFVEEKWKIGIDLT